MEKKQRYPLGIQTFDKIIEGNYYYADKTEYIYKLTQEYSYVFLSRPRRFGKSLLCSTLRVYFSGNKDLFKGLKIAAMKTEWKKHPVLYFNLSQAKRSTVEEVKNRLSLFLSEYEKSFNIIPESDDIGYRMSNLIKVAAEQTGEKTVVIIDEYDAPLLNVVDNDELFVEIRTILRTFFSPLKDSDEFLRFVFLTGVTKFSQLSIFSEINNLTKISMFNDFSGICGITENELKEYFSDGIEEFGRANNTDFGGALAILKSMYDGYHFSKKSEDVYNPYSLINALVSKDATNFWFDSGTPTFLVKMLNKFNTPIMDMENCDCADTDFDLAIEQMVNTIPVFYHAGYLTIKNYEFGCYTLGFPNREVREGLCKTLIPNYLKLNTMQNNSFVIKFQAAMRKGMIDNAMQIFKSYCASIPYDLNNQNEKHYHLVFFLFFNLLGAFIESEVKFASGRTDCVVKSPDAIFVFEFKHDKSAAEALAQIDTREYLIAYQADGRKLYKIGANFSTETKTVEEWIIFS